MFLKPLVGVSTDLQLFKPWSVCPPATRFEPRCSIIFEAVAGVSTDQQFLVFRFWF